MPMVNDADSLNWGRLVKSWATGLDYINTPAANQPPHLRAAACGLGAAANCPPSISTRRRNGSKDHSGRAPPLHRSVHRAAGAAGIDAVNYPPGTTEVIIVQGNATTMVIRLPPTSVLQASEVYLLNGGAYPTPTFYDPLYSPPAAPSTPIRRYARCAGLMELHANRIGDYTMGLCA